LCSLKAILPASSGPPVVVSDAGFKGPFFEAVLELGWNFLGRVRGTTTARPSDGESISKEEFYAAATIHPADLGWFELFPRGLAIRSRLVLVRKRRKPGRKPPPPKNKEEREMRQAALDPWLLATSVPDGDAAFIVGLYAKRMQIEETFRDAKNHRFGWSLGDVQLSTHRRMGALLVLAAVAMTVVTLIGMESNAWAPTAVTRPTPRSGVSSPSSCSPAPSWPRRCQVGLSRRISGLAGLCGQRGKCMNSWGSLRGWGEAVVPLQSRTEISRIAPPHPYPLRGAERAPVRCGLGLHERAAGPPYRWTPAPASRAMGTPRATPGADRRSARACHPTTGACPRGRRGRP
jgi:hypothetical protein